MPVNSQHADYAKMVSKWQRCRDVAAGEEAVQEAAEKYVPKLAGQTSAEYAAYVLRASFYNATWRTISGLTGMMFRKPPKVEVPETIKTLLEDVDGAGLPLPLFLQDTAENGLTVGGIGILVDYPQAPEGITQADAIRLNLRPWMKVYRAEAIINWRMAVINNRNMPAMIVLEECAEIPIDEFANSEEKRWRVLDLVPTVNPLDKTSSFVYRQREYREKKQQNANSAVKQFEQVGGDVFPKINGKNWAEIPFVRIGTDDVGFDVDDPPLIDLVNTNISHFRVSADYEHGCHFTGSPTLLLTGFAEEKDANGNSKSVYVGGETAIVSSNEKAQGKYIEFSGDGLASLERNLDKKEKQMAVLGARMLEEQKKGVESAETAGIHRAGEESMLASVSISISLGVTIALKWFVEWAGADPANVSVQVNREFYPPAMNPQMLTALVAAWQSGVPGMSDQGIFDQLKNAEIVADDVTLEEEQARIAERQLQLMNQFGAPASGDPLAGTPPTETQSSSSPQPIIIQLPKGNGKRTVTGPNGQKYTIEES
jgi:hypothetical protein